MSAGAMLLALALDAAFGWPQAAMRRIGHPVVWAGRLIEALEARLNRPDLPAGERRRNGAAAALLVTVTAALAGGLAEAVLPAGAAGVLLAAVLAWPLVAARSLHSHVAAVARPLAAGDGGGARRAVAMLVGRDPARLDPAGMARATLESLAENASDGVVAPLFWGVLLGLPGIAAYKAINTLDSMIGHRDARFADFGRFAARLDDLVNWPAARLTAALIALASGRPLRVLARARAGAATHRSPNAGWPEAAMAAALGVRLSGPRIYAGTIADEPWLNPGAPDPDAATIGAGLALYRRAVLALAALLMLLVPV